MHATSQPSPSAATLTRLIGIRPRAPRAHVTKRFIFQVFVLFTRDAHPAAVALLRAASLLKNLQKKSGE